jgi:YesN/AraC family two-component response regulator
MRVQRPLLLRIDFTREGCPLGLPPTARGQVELRSIRPSASLYQDIAAIQPDVLCFDYDCPEFDGLARLRQVKKDFSSLPILMLTEHNSEQLTVWALRSRVWDYFVKPLDTEAFVQAIQQLHELRSGGERSAARKIIVPASSWQRDKDCRTGVTDFTNAAERAVAKAKTYVARNFAEKISAREVAELCNMSAFHFSRSFKRICGLTFSDYLLELRIRKAIELLGRPSATVTGTCYEVGFRDPSYFGRIFKRYAGITPSEYRDRHIQRASQNTSATEQSADPSGRGEAEDEGTTALKAELLLRLRR